MPTLKYFAITTALLFGAIVFSSFLPLRGDSRGDAKLAEAERARDAAAKAQIDLRAKLAVAEAARDSAVRDKVALQQSIAKTAATSAANALNSKLSNARADVAATASSDAVKAQDVAAQQVEVARQGQAAAKVAAEALDRKTDTTNKALALVINGFYALITAVSLAVATFVFGEIRRTQDSKQAAHSADVMDAKLNQIHALVNSNLTAAMNETLVARKANLALLLEASAVSKAAGRKPVAEAQSIIDTMSTSIHELESSLSDRLAQTYAAAKKLQEREEKA